MGRSDDVEEGGVLNASDVEDGGEERSDEKSKAGGSLECWTTFCLQPRHWQMFCSSNFRARDLA